MKKNLPNSIGWQLYPKRCWKNYFMMCKLVPIIFSIIMATVGYGQVTSSDSLALVDLYNSTNGASWINHNNWLVNGQSVNTWAGVTVSSGRVTKLNLSDGNGNLTGTIPASIGDLTALTLLELGNNNLSGNIPSSIGNLKALTLLALANNQLSGEIPLTFSDLTVLTELWLNGNNLSGSVQPLSSLTALTFLNISDNQFTFAGMEQVEEMGISQFIYSPQYTILNLTSNNGMLSVNAGGTLSNNIYTWYKNGIQVNQVTGDSTYTPTALGSYYVKVTNSVATSLTLTSNTVVLSQTNFQPDSLALVDLYNSTNGANWTNNTNWLRGNVSTWYGVTVSGGRVTQLNLTTNNLVGILPSTIGNVTALTRLDLWQNKLSGSIPSSISNLIALTYLSVDSNQLSGSVQELSNLSLTYLDLYGDKFTFAGMEKVVQAFSGLGNKFAYGGQANVNISKNGNVLSVNVGGTLANNTYKWYQNGNEVATITGDSTYTIPNGNTGIFYVTVTNSIATALTLTSNAVNITVSPSDSLALVDLYNSTNGANWTNNTNWLSGNVSTWYGVTVSDGRVTQLNFSNNLVGTIPSSIGNLTALQYLYLSNNKLSGEVPSSIGNLTSLIGFNVNGNQLSGTIPSTIGNLTSIIALGWDHNQFSGTIPAEMGNMTSLQRLYLNDNQLNGIMPSTIDSLTALTLLELQNNLFTFDGLEQIAQDDNIKTLNYSPQANINITLKDSVLSVSAGGTLSNNTYTWYQNGTQVKQITGDSTLTLNDNPGSYYVEVTNSAAQALTLTSNTLTVVITNVIEKNTAAKVYPTLTNDVLNIELPDNATAMITMYDLTGRPVLAGKTLEEKISQVDISSFSQGMYLLRIQDLQTHQQSTFKFIKE